MSFLLSDKTLYQRVPYEHHVLAMENFVFRDITSTTLLHKATGNGGKESGSLQAHTFYTSNLSLLKGFNMRKYSM